MSLKRGRFGAQEKVLIQNMNNAGVPAQEIAQNLNRSVESVKKVLESLNAQAVN